MLSEKRDLVRNTLVNGLSQSAAMVAAFVFMPMLVSAFGIQNYGLYVLISAVAAYAMLLDFGLGTALTKTVAEADATGDRTLAEQAVATATSFYSVVGVVAALAMVLMGVFATSIFHISPRDVSLLQGLLYVSAAFQLVQWPTSTARYVLAGAQRYDAIAASSLLGTVLSIAATIWVIVAGKGPIWLMGLNGVAMAVQSLVMVWAATRLAGARRPELRLASWNVLKKMLVFSWAVFVVQLSDVLFYQQTDRIILGVLVGAIAVGLYEASAKMNSLVLYLSGLTVSAVVPLASSMYAGGRSASLRSLFARGSKYGAALIAPLTAVIVVFADPLLVAWLGREYAGQGVVMQVLLFPHILVCVGLMGDAIVISQGRMGRRVPYIVAQAVLNVVLSVYLVGRMGVLGVALGTAIAHVADFPIHIRFLLQETHVTFAEWLREVVAPVYPLLLLPVVICAALVRTPLAGSLLGIFASMAVALAAYWGGFYLVGLSAGERHELLAVVGSLLTRGPTSDGGV